jgi:hypothetical protein
VLGRSWVVEQDVEFLDEGARLASPGELRGPMIPFSCRDLCLLCGRPAEARPADGDEQRWVVKCPGCRSFLIDSQLADVVANAWTRSLYGILDQLPLLSSAARRAGEHGRMLSLTSTNWILVAARVVMAERREQAADSEPRAPGGATRRRLTPLREAHVRDAPARFA